MRYYFILLSALLALFFTPASAAGEPGDFAYAIYCDDYVHNYVYDNFPQYVLTGYGDMIVTKEPGFVRGKIENEFPNVNFEEVCGQFIPVDLNN